MQLVETHELTKRYGEFAALDRCTMEVRSGEVFGLLGPNGAGKTTLLRLLMGYLQPTCGSASIDGLDCYHDSVRVHERVSYLPGDAHVFEGMSGQDVLAFFAEIRPGSDLRRSLDIAERLSLDYLGSVGHMSTGMRQKLALAAVMATDTPLVILDEPTANLDPNVRSEVLRIVAEARTQGRTVVFSSHVLSEVEEVCDRVVILRQGHLVHTQNLSELRRQHRIKARLTGPLGEPPAELRDGLTIVHPDKGRVMIETADELSPLLGWLARLPLAEVNIEPVGLRAVYDRYHQGKDAPRGTREEEL